MAELGRDVSLDEVLLAIRSGYWGEETPTSDRPVRAQVVRNSDISNVGRLTGSATRYLSDREAQLSELRIGDTVMTASGDIGKHWLVDRSGFHATNFVRVLRPDPNEILPGYLPVVLQAETTRSLLVEHTGTSVIPNLRSGFFREARINLPSLPEQRRVIDLFDAIRMVETAAGHVSAAATRQAQRALLTAIDSSSVSRRLGDLAVVKGGKRLPKGTPWSAVPTDHPYIRVIDIVGGRINTGDLTYVPADVWPLISRYVVAGNDVVITIVGTIGRVAVVPPSLSGANLTENAALIRTHEGLDPRYLAAFLQTETGQREITRLTVGTTQPKLALFRIEDIDVPYLDLVGQQSIVAIFEAFDELAHSAVVEAECLARLRRSLASNVAIGNLRIDDSYDRLLDVS